jgi:hypothetical protein
MHLKISTAISSRLAPSVGARVVLPSLSLKPFAARNACAPTGTCCASPARRPAQQIPQAFALTEGAAISETQAKPIPKASCLVENIQSLQVDSVP